MDNASSHSARNNNKPFARLAILFIIGIVLLVGTIAILMYTKWHSGSEKALLDAINYARKSPAMYTVTTADGSNYTVESDGVQIALKGNVQDVRLEAIADGKDIYLRTSTPKEFIDMIVQYDVDEKAPEYLDDWIKSIKSILGDQWILVKIDSFEPRSLAVTAIQCAIGLRMNISEADNSLDNVRDTYLSNRFIVTRDTSTKKDNTTYTFSMDENRLRGFFSGLQQTNLGGKTTDCGYVPDFMKKAGYEEVVYDITISQSQHRLQKIIVRDGKTEFATVTVDNAARPEIEVPSNAFDADKLLQGLSVIEQAPASLRQ